LKHVRVSIALLSICLLLSSAYAQATGLSVKWVWNDGSAIPQGKESSSASITLSNEGKVQLRLEFVGLHFAWMPNDTYTYGGGSEKANVLVPGQSITYMIPFGIPKNLPTGLYKCYAIIVHHVANDSAWTKVTSAHFAPENLQIVPVVVVTITSTTTLAQPADWTVDFAVLLAFTIIGLALLATFRSRRREKVESVKEAKEDSGSEVKTDQV
jgi:hypothetical protein